MKMLTFYPTPLPASLYGSVEDKAIYVLVLPPHKVAVFAHQCCVTKYKRYHIHAYAGITKV